jgi:hypothetical protein
MRLRISFLKLLSAIAVAVSLASAQVPDITWYTNNPDAASYEISNADQLAGLATLTNRASSAVDFSGKTITLVANIDLFEKYGAGYNGGKGWIPIRGGGVTFDGNGKIISGLYINNSNLGPAGLFGSTGQGMIKNLGLVGVNIIGDEQVGGIVGSGGGTTVNNCYTTGTVKGSRYVGGVVGRIVTDRYRTNSVTMCYSTAKIEIGGSNVGGVVGQTTGVEVRMCYSTGTVEGTYYVGGVVGSLHGNDEYVKNCFSTGMVTGTESVGWDIFDYKFNPRRRHNQRSVQILRRLDNPKR